MKTSTILKKIRTLHINPHTAVIENIHMWDFPDFCDAHCTYAEWSDGTPLTDEELDNIDSSFINETIHNQQLYL